MQDDIVFLGHFDEIPSLLKSSDIFVCTSISEASPMSVWEAMAMEKAIVTTDVGAVKKYIKNGKSGYVVPIKNPQELFNKVNFLLKNRKKMNLFGKEAREVSKHYLDVEIAAKKYKIFYNNILKTEKN